MTATLFAWDLCLALAAGALAIYLMLPTDLDTPTRTSRRVSAFIGTAAILLLLFSVGRRAGWWQAVNPTSVVTSVLFWLLASCAVAAAVATVTATRIGRALQAFCLLLASNAGLFLLFGNVLLSAATLATLIGMCLLGWIVPSRWPNLLSVDTETRRSDEPFAACAAGMLLCITLVGTIHHSLTSEARRAERNPRLSATPRLDVIDERILKRAEAGRPPTIRNGGVTEPPGPGRDAVAAGICGALLLCGVIGTLTTVRRMTHTDRAPEATTGPL